MRPDTMLDKRFGVVFFDDVDDPNSGWACLGGGPDTKPKRISGPEDLSTSAIWWCNVDLKSGDNRLEFWRLSQLRPNYYLPIKLARLLAEWSIDMQTAPPSAVTQFAAVLFTRIMTLSYRLIQNIDPDRKASDIFVGMRLAEDYVQIMPTPLYPKDEAASIMQAGKAFEHFTATSIPPRKSSRLYTVIKPRIPYALEMLRTPIPHFDKPFEFVSRRKLQKFGPNIISHLQSLNKPAMAEISVERIDGELAKIFGFAASTSRAKRSQRSWVTTPEFSSLARHAEIEVNSAWIGESYTTYMDHLPHPIKAFLTSPASGVSWSAGIVAETIWRATGLADSTGFGMGSPISENAKTSWQGAWIRGADKISMFETAWKLTQQEHSVISYGSGWLHASVFDEEKTEFQRDALSVGMYPSMLSVEPKEFSMDEKIQWGGAPNAYLLVAIHMACKNKILDQLDMAPLQPRKTQEEYVRNLFSSLGALK
ncbi:hypothetical protein [Flexibacterium corallicola]|uniref:hypothetical protein n=1 Tax=Flexibacterium corallicola TaxID=3037259 RepID=UPI00286F8DDD|nr:hypothetical protein [Pseudovibrio sp. M1P-2-3]